MAQSGVTTNTDIGSVDINALDGPVKRWQVVEAVGTVRCRKLWSITGCGIQGGFGVYNSDKRNLLRGVYERVLYRVQGEERRLPPAPTVGVYANLLSVERRSMARLVGTCRPITRQQFVESYVGRKRTMYQNAADSLSTKPLRRSDSFVSTFTKCEKVRFSHKPDPAPRVIQPRSPRYNVEVGRYLKQLERKICDGMTELWSGRTIMKGMNAEGVASALRDMWDEFDDPVAIPLDAVRFDQHVSVDALSWEHDVYLDLFPKCCRDKLRWLLAMQLENVGYGRLGDALLKYIVMGRRMSGDMNTGMGNCLIMCAIIHCFKRLMGVRMRLANNGDDCCIILEKRNLGVITELPGHMLKFGFVVEVEKPLTVFEQIQFCQCNPVFDGVRWVMVRDPRVCIDKDLCTVLPLGDPGYAAKWAGAIGACGQSMSGGIPVLSAFYSMLSRAGTSSNLMSDPWMDSGFARMAQGLNRAVVDPSDACRVSFWRAFGILPDVQTAMEEEYKATVLHFSVGELVSPHQFLRHVF